MATGLEKKEEGVIPTFARLNLFPPSAYANFFILVIPLLFGIGFGAWGNLLVAVIVGGALAAISLWLSGTFKSLGCAVEVHTEHIALYRWKKLVWQCRWSDIGSVERTLHQTIIELRDGSQHAIHTQNLTPKARAALGAYIPRHLMRELSDKVTVRRMSRREAKVIFVVGIAVGLSGLVGCVISRNAIFAGAAPGTLTQLMAYGVALVVGSALAFIGGVQPRHSQEKRRDLSPGRNSEVKNPPLGK